MSERIKARKRNNYQQNALNTSQNHIHKNPKSFKNYTLCTEFLPYKTRDDQVQQVQFIINQEPHKSYSEEVLEDTNDHSQNQTISQIFIKHYYEFVKDEVIDANQFDQLKFDEQSNVIFLVNNLTGNLQELFENPKPKEHKILIESD